MTDPGDRSVVYMPLDEIVAATVNPKRHATAQLAASLARFGFTEPALLDERTGRLVAGHGRTDTVRAAHNAGLDPPNGVQMLDDGRWAVPVIRGWSSTDDGEAAAYLVASNRLTETGGWDDVSLADLLTELADGPAGLDGSGFTDDDLADLIASVAPPPVKQTDPDAVPEPPAEPITKRGDVWQLGPHRLICGDATSEADHATLLEGTVCDLVLTDPPYGVGVDYGEGFVDDEATVAALIGGFMPLALRHRRALVTSGQTLIWLYPRPKWVLAWVEPSGVGVGPWGFACTHLVLAYGTDPYLAAGLGARPDTYVGKGEGPSSDEHPVAKPAAVWAWLMERGTTEPGQTVLDPFCGSGTTLIAAHQLGRVAYGIELSPAYVDVAVKRWCDHTGLTAVNVTAGATWEPTPVT